MLEFDSQTTHNGDNGNNEVPSGLARLMLTMERDRRQTEENHAKMLEMQAKMLEQIATKLAEPREARERNKEAQMGRLPENKSTNFYQFR